MLTTLPNKIGPLNEGVTVNDRIGFAALAFWVLLVSINGCTSPTSSTSNTVDQNETLTITSVDWVGENIDPAYWSSPQSESLYFDFWVNYTGNVSASDIQSVSINTPNGDYSWSINPATYANTANGYIGGWESFDDNRTSNIFLLGSFVAVVNLTNGKQFTHAFTITTPSSNSTNGKSSVYSAEATAPSGGTPILPRALVTGGSASASSVTVNFTLNDPSSLVYSGYVWLFDSGGSYLGGDSYLFSPSTGASSGLLNSGAALKRNGTTNTITITSTDAGLTTGTNALSNVAQAVVVLTDGSQLTQTTSGLNYNYRSLSNKKVF